MSNFEQADCDDQLSKLAVYVLTGIDISFSLRKLLEELALCYFNSFKLGAKCFFSNKSYSESLSGLTLDTYTIHLYSEQTNVLRRYFKYFEKLKLIGSTE